MSILVSDNLAMSLYMFEQSNGYEFYRLVRVRLALPAAPSPLYDAPVVFYVEITEPLAFSRVFAQEGCYSRGNKTALLVKTAVKRCVIPPWWLTSRRIKVSQASSITSAGIGSPPVESSLCQNDKATNSTLSPPNPNIVAFGERQFRKGREKLNFHAKNEHPQYSDLNSSRRCVCTILVSSQTSSTHPRIHLTLIAGFFGYAVSRRDDTGEPHAMTHMHTGLY
ncbi:hypothetical protein BDV93DRAFT_517021, partial [Ceratobasidium sp. AG-I]